MTQIKNVLCPVDFSEISRQEMALAVDVCQAFGARLVLHHNLIAAPPGLTRAWEWNELHQEGAISEDEAERRIRDLMAGLPTGLHAEASVSRGPVGVVLIEMARSIPADLIVLGSHGRSTEEHSSLTERIVDERVCPVLTIHDGAQMAHFRLHTDAGEETTRAVVPVDLSAASKAVVSYACGLARHVPLEVCLLHVVAATTKEKAIEEARHELASLVPADAAACATLHVEPGDAVETIVRFSAESNAGFVVMGEHTRSLLRRLFLRDTAKAVLQEARCPVWFVPPPR